ncbi:MAG: RagB/SusD family nutrient uptake outer membrane protein [Prolixibacteraceae bacterium]|nr:RagB/SusD family nutrient uptake outer membrane protein [Prolixibacteraceae bacterium]
MKTIYVIIIISLFTAMACNDDYLEKYPLDQVNDGSFWKSAADLAMYANQFYPDLKPNTERSWEFEDPTDNNGPSVRNAYAWNESIVPATGGGYGKSDWLGIRSCNYALDKITTMKKDAEVLMYEAEIRFFKSFYYFSKVKSFGDVPWFDHALQTDSEDLVRARDSRKTVIANLLKDLDFAIANLPATSAADRLTKWAALAFKSRVCLFEGTFRKYHNLGDHEALLRDAVSSSESIINSALFSVYTTGKPNSDYFDLFVQYELKGNPEGIMVQRYIEGKRTHDHVRQMSAAHSGYTKDFVEAYLCKDGLPIALSTLYKGDAVFGDEFIDRDPRMRQSVYNSDRPFRIYDTGVIEYKKMPEFLYGNAFTSYYILKGFSLYERDWLQGHATIDDFVFRYGEILINYAEAKAELGEGTQQVLDKSVNLLRDRVGMPHLTVNVGFVDPNWPNWEVPVAPLVNEIRRERRVELADEGFRWDDLMRWKAGKLLENTKTYLGARDPLTSNNYRVLYPGYTRKWNDKLYLHPIPTQEIALNPKLKQNPGW